MGVQRAWAGGSRREIRDNGVKRPRFVGHGTWASSQRRSDWTTRGSLLTLPLLLAALLVALFAPVASVRAAPQIPTSWSRVTSPNVVGGASNTRHPSIFGGIPPANILSGVAAVSANDVWAVGSYSTAGVGVIQTLTERWNGASWSVVPSANVGGTANQNSLNGVTAISANDVWAVGSYSNPNTNTRQTLIEHWTGSSWSVVPSPNVNGTTDSNYLNAVAAVSASDVWAVGYYYDTTSSTGPDQTLVEQWNGTEWSVMASPNLGGTADSNVLSGVAAVSANDVWAVGSYGPATGPTGLTLIEQWTGTAWNVIPSADPSSSANQDTLSAVAEVSASDVWAVGSYVNSSGLNQTLIEQWNGTAWSIVTSPNAGSTTGDILYGVAVLSASNIWAVGYYFPSGGGERTLIEQWNGTAWSIVASPNPSTSSTLFTIAAVSTNDVWTVGYYYDATSNADLTLTERYGYLLFGPTPGTTRGATGRSIR